MKLNHDCVRFLLLKLEEDLDDSETIFINELKLKRFKKSEIMYAAKKLIEAGFLTGDLSYGDNQPEIYISEITWEGHKFLDNIRDPAVWEHSKSVLSKFLSTSIGIVENVSAQVITNLIEKELGLNPIP